MTDLDLTRLEELAGKGDWYATERERGLCEALPSLLAAARAVQRVEALFSGGPDTACRTVWQDGIECVSVPLDDLRAALGGAE